MNDKSFKTLLFNTRLQRFAEESDRIEGIFGEEESEAHAKRLAALLDEPQVTIGDLCTFNKAGSIRSCHGMNVMVGKHLSPAGGPQIIHSLKDICDAAEAGADPYRIHQRFETLHPFMDGNGRTGRALWLWQMVNQQGYRIQLGFLHKWYYESLDRDDDR